MRPTTIEESGYAIRGYCPGGRCLGAPRARHAPFSDVVAPPADSAAGPRPAAGPASRTSVLRRVLLCPWRPDARPLRVLVVNPQPPPPPAPEPPGAPVRARRAGAAGRLGLLLPPP